MSRISIAATSIVILVFIISGYIFLAFLHTGEIAHRYAALQRTEIYSRGNRYSDTVYSFRDNGAHVLYLKERRGREESWISLDGTCGSNKLCTLGAPPDGADCRSLNLSKIRHSIEQGVANVFSEICKNHIE